MLTHDEIRIILSGEGLARQADEIIQSLMPAVRLLSGDEPNDLIPTGASKFGGDPDLPVGVTRPTRNGEPLHLLMQLRMDDLPHKYLEQYELPRRGILWAWVDSLALFEGPPDGNFAGRTPYAHLDPVAYQLTFLPCDTDLIRCSFPG